jgi:hypothetical protein
VLIETKSNPAEKPETPKSRRRWHAVTVVTSGSPCAAALACKGKRFLSSEAPRFPLAKCDAARCDCKYRHYDDRRSGPRRAEESGAPAGRTTQNRREKRGRRAAD